MKKIIWALLFFPLLAQASDDYVERYFSTKKVVPTPQEAQALAIAKKWQTGASTSKPFVGRDGSIQYVFSSAQIQVMCAVLQVCDIALQPGEQISAMDVGDDRYIVTPAITNTPEGEQLHLLLKPLDVGLDSTYVVTTSRRTYHFRLRSSRREFMPYISFHYPEDMQAKLKAIQIRQQKERVVNTIPETHEYLGNLDFNYAISGSARWRPCRVYNDGVKTIIEMPATLQQNDAPSLLVLRGRGFLQKDETVVVNYRLQNNRYIIDNIFDKAMLVAGVGRSQQKVVITRRG